MSANQLRTIFETMNAHQAEKIREAYYDAVAGLQNLVTALEVADTDAGPLLTEHLLACHALEVMNKSELGKVL